MMKGVNNETLLAWSDYEVIKARTVLHSAEVQNKLLEETVRIEKENEKRVTDSRAYLKKLGFHKIVWSMAETVEEIEAMVEEQKEFLRKCGVSEEELRP